MKAAQPVDRRERVLLVGVALKKPVRAKASGTAVASRDSLDELQELAESAGAKIAGSLLQVPRRAGSRDPRGAGASWKRSSAEAQHQASAPLVIVDHMT
jgi:50S ribosomal subunit-associated GTPase HflX